jgi:hemerythrin
MKFLKDWLAAHIMEKDHEAARIMQSAVSSEHA